MIDQKKIESMEYFKYLLRFLTIDVHTKVNLEFLRQEQY